uniref:ADF-H domain-containing protein n=2 Tax=Caenorhabditis japonica TaxID=281687 RepID=A0A8R1HZ77_CAEJA
MASSLAICSIPDDVKGVLKRFRFAKNQGMSALIFKIGRETHKLECEHQWDDCTLEELKDELPSQQPRFVLISWCKKHADERISYPMLFVYYCPNGSSPELQMMYAGSRNHIVNECSVSKNIEVRDIDELDDDLLDSKF